MTAAEKSAYRYLIYQAMLDIRIWCDWHVEESSDPEVWRARHSAAREAGAVAYWLHNLALASANDFANFDTVAFWNQGDFFRARFPNAALERYREIFDARLKDLNA